MQSASRLATADKTATGAAARVLSLRANFSWTFAGNVVYSGCQWAMLVALTKLGSQAMAGQFVLGLAVTAPVLMLTNLQLRAVQATDARRDYRFGHYLGLRFLTTPLALLIIAALTFLSGYGKDKALIILAVGLAKAFESISDVFYGLLQQHERMDRIAMSMIMKGLFSLAALAGVLYLTHSVLWSTLALAAVWALVLVGYDVRNGAHILQGAVERGMSPPRRTPRGMSLQRHVLSPLWDAPRLTKLALLALPVGLVMMLISLSANIPRYFVDHDLGDKQLGIFGALAYVLVAGTTVTDALGQAVSPRLSRYYAGGDMAAFRALLLKLLGVGAALGLAGVAVAILTGHAILTLLYRPDYARHADVLVWLLVASGVGYLASFLGYAITAARRFKVQVPISVVVVVVMAVGAAFVIPAHGLVGAAWVTLLGAAIQLPLKGLIIARMLRRRGATRDTRKAKAVEVETYT